MVSRARASKAAILLAVCGLGLGACSAHPGTAAIVGDTRISEADVSLTSQQLSGLLGQDVDASRLLPTLNQNLAIGKVAEKNGITVSDQEITDSLAEMGQEVVQRGGKSTPITNPRPSLRTRSPSRSCVPPGCINSNWPRRMRNWRTQFKQPRLKSIPGTAPWMRKAVR